MNRRSLSKALRLGAVLLFTVVVLGCVILTLSGVTGPTEVNWGSVVEYVVDVAVTYDGGDNHPWRGYIAADVPEDWTFHSFYYYGEIAGDPVEGIGFEFHGSFLRCELDWPPVAPGYVRLWVETDLHDTPPGDGWVRAWVRFNAISPLGRYTLAFHASAYGSSTPEPWTYCCPDTSYITVNVSDSLIFADNFNSGTTSAWSTVVP